MNLRQKAKWEQQANTNAIYPSRLEATKASRNMHLLPLQEDIPNIIIVTDDDYNKFMSGISVCENPLSVAISRIAHLFCHTVQK